MPAKGNSTVLTVKAASSLQGALELPASPDLFLLSAAAAATCSTPTTITPCEPTPLIESYCRLLAPICTITIENGTATVTPLDRTESLTLEMSDDLPYRDFLLFFFMGMGASVMHTPLTESRLVSYTLWAQKMNLSIETLEVGTRKGLRLQNISAFSVPKDDMTSDDLYPLIGFCLGARKDCALTITYAWQSPLRNLLPALGYDITVKSNLPMAKRDSLEARLRFLQKKKKNDEGQTFTLTTSFVNTPALNVRIELPGDETLAALFIVAKSLIAKGNLIISNICLESWALPTLDFIRKMGCKPAIQETGRSTFGSRGGVQLQPYTLSGRTTSCRPIAHYDKQLPALAVLASFTAGQTVLRDLEALRAADPDRLEQILSCVQAVGARFGDMPDGLIIEGAKQLDGFDISEVLPAELAGAFAIAGMKCMGETHIADEELARRWPLFKTMLDSLCEWRD